VPGIDQRSKVSRLQDQIPEVGFPSGVGVPSLVCLILLLTLAGFCIVHLSAPEPRAVAPAVVEAQQRLAANTARSIAASAVDGAHDLGVAAAAKKAAGAGKADDVVKAVSRSDRRWRGVALLDRSTNSVLAQQGEAIPLDLLPSRTVDRLTVFPVPRPSGDVLLLTYLPYDGGKVQSQALVASRTLRVPKVPVDEDLRQGVLVMTSSGALVSAQGSVPGKDDQAVNDLVDQARSEASSGKTGVVTGAASGDSAPLVAYAPVSTDDTASTGLGLSLISVVHAPITSATPAWTGVLPAAALTVLAALAYLLLRQVLVQPVRRLRTDALSTAGGDLDAAPRRPRARELRSIADAFGHVRSRLGRSSDEEGGTARRGLSCTGALTVATALLIAWSAGVVIMLGQGAVSVPGQLAHDAEWQTTSAADAVRRTINEGVNDLKAVANASTGVASGSLQPALEHLAERQSRYRSVYVADENGHVVALAGRAALRDPAAPPRTEGVSLHEGVQRVPTIFAHVPLPDSPHTLVAEYDVEYLSGLLGRSAPGRVRIVDSKLRVVVDTRGYLPFAELGGEQQRRTASEALNGHISDGEQNAGGGAALISAAPLRGGAADELKWAVVGEQPVSELGLAENELRRGATLVALLATIIAVLQFGWHHFVLLRPLRLAGRSAREIVAGDTGTVVYPQRQDEIGTIASCLEICRQALVDGVKRLGEVRRPKGAATDPTELLKPVAAPLPAPKTPAARRPAGKTATPIRERG
jgi:methyl-accepting chemotaxis protein